MDKYCSKCKTRKSVADFNKNKARGDGLQATCRVCDNALGRAHYSANKQSYKDRARLSNRVYRDRVCKFMLNHFKDHPCVDCGEDDPVVLDFDHLRDKEYNISQMVQNQRSLDAIQIEMNKCQVRCSNCHRRKTAKQFGWKKLLLKENI
jgi:hypothetical protein